MPYQPLHHKYRPQIFKDLVGQETIALTLSNALEQEKIAPAYLFTGPRGTGKTSSARILAKSLNCLNSSKPTANPCGVCEACQAIANGSALDVMEIDAASNTGVDNIREIIERSRFAPVQCRYKIYAIDECHMLSTAAFNALLKTLEEPPPKVVFILATTDPQRVLSTIISRCQRFDYRRIPLPEMISHLKYIAGQENIAVANDAIALIAQIANGGLRDAESLLDQLSLLPEEISVAKVWDLVGAVPEQDLLKLLQAVNQQNSIAILKQCRSLLDRGREPIVVLQNLASFYLNLLIAKTAPQHPEMVAVTETCWQQLCETAESWDVNSIFYGQQHLKEAESQLKHTTQPRLWLEVTLLGLLPQVLPTTETIVQTSYTACPPPKSPQAKVLSPAKSLDNGEQFNSDQHSAVVAQAPPISLSQPKTESINDQIPAKIPIESTSIPIAPAETAKSEKSMIKANSQAVVINDAGENTKIWSQVVSCLQPPTTQALLKQQCYLVNFDGLSAVVGISSAKLQKLNQGKVPNIETAFAQVCQRKVRVQLEVVTPKNKVENHSSDNNIFQSTVVQEIRNKLPSPEKPTAQSFIDSPTPEAILSESIESPKKLNPVKQPDVQHNGSGLNQTINREDIVKSNPVENFQTSAPPEFKSSINTPVISPTTTTTTFQSVSESAINGEQTDNYLQQAIDNLTLSFEGELVPMDSLDDPFIQENETVQIIANPTLDRPDPEDYEDDW